MTTLPRFFNGALEKLAADALSEFYRFPRPGASMPPRVGRIVLGNGMLASDGNFWKDDPRPLVGKVPELRLPQCPPWHERLQEKDVTAVLTQLRDLLQSDVGLAAPVLKELVGDVVIESRVAEGQSRPQMFARFTIEALPALALIGRVPNPESANSASSLWGYLREELDGTPALAAGSRVEIVVRLRRHRRNDEQ